MASMQYDVKSVRLTADGQAVNYRTRVKAVYGLAGASAGSVKFYDGTGTTGELLLDMDTPAGTGNNFYVLIPGEGILFRTGVYVDVTNITGVTVIYG
jgi:hypothetical protein